VYNRYEDSSTTFRVMVRAPLDHNDYRLHHSIAEPLTSRHESRINHHIMVLVRTAGLALRESPAVRILHQTMVQHQIMVRKGAQRSDL